MTPYNQLRTLIDALPDYVYFKDINHRFIDANVATVRIMKCKSPEDLIGKTDFDFYPKEYADKFFADEEEIFKSGQSKLDIEETVIDEGKNLKILSTSKVILRNKEGNVVGLVGIGRDITERKQAEEILKRDNEMFERILEERTKKLLETQSELERARHLSDIGKLAAMVGHELRNPLGIINLATHNLKKDKTLTENPYVLNIEKQVYASNIIIDNLLTYSRIKTPTYEIVDLFKILDECVSDFEDDFKDFAITVEKQYGSEFQTIELDPYQMKQVFINILNNAGQAFPNKQGTIELCVTHENDFMRVSFKDNGTGIDPDDLDKIFQPFFTRKQKGTGLGLAICNELVHLHRGKIEVKSRKGEGTTFCVILPLKK